MYRSLSGAAAFAAAFVPSFVLAATAQPADSIETITVTAQRLNEARTGIETQTGASTYTIDAKALQATPGGFNTPLNQVILQAPGVVQDSFGQLHIRGDHNGLQYRLNGVILPEGLSAFGQVLNPRLISSMKLITGVVPAEYGLRTAGIVDLTTKSGALEPGGTVSIYGGSHGTIQPSFNYGATSGPVTYFVSGDYVSNDLGIESPDGRADPLHDHTKQYHGFAYLDDILNPDNRVSLVLGTSRGAFQIPNTAGGQPDLGLVVNGRSTFPSENLDENQREITHFGIVSLQHAAGDFDLNTSLITRYSSLSYKPDVLGELLYNGIAQQAYKRDVSVALQNDAAYRLSDAHTLRAGFYIQADRSTSLTTSQVLRVDADGNPLNDRPAAIIDNSANNQWIESVYLQDEWQVLDRVTLNYGLRFDHFTAYDRGSQLSPRANLLWNATDSTELHIGYARYLTPPPFELVGGQTIAKFANTTAAPEVTANNPVKAERADYVDAGLQQKLFDMLTLGVDAFYRSSRNLIDEGQFGAPIIQTPFNYAKGKIYGVEFTANLATGPLSAYVNMSLAQARAEHIVSSEFNFSQDDLDYIANHFINLDHEQHFTISGGASYLYEDTRLSADMLLGSGLRTDGVQPDGSVIPNGGRLPYYTQVNLGISHSFALTAATKLEARFDVINLFDEIYQIRNGTGVGVGAPQFGPRRGFFGGLAIQF